MLTESFACPLIIIGQCGVHFSLGVMCNQHKGRAVAGAMSVINANVAATSLERHAIFLALMLRSRCSWWL